jgi:hypothetical protein
MRWACSILLLALAGCAASVGATGPTTGPFAEGRRLYVAKCAKCHKFYDPAEYSEQDWQIWMRKMSKKAKLKPEQETAISGYVDNVLRGAKTGAAK